MAFDIFSRVTSGECINSSTSGSTMVVIKIMTSALPDKIFSRDSAHELDTKLELLSIAMPLISNNFLQII